MSGVKKSKEVGEHNYQIGDVVLAKIRGYPRWPGMVRLRAQRDLIHRVLGFSCAH